LDPVVSAFRTSPVSNIDGQNGVNLHVLVDAGDQNLPQANWPSSAAGAEWTPFDNAKRGDTTANFGLRTDADRAPRANILDAMRLFYRYAIFADARNGTGSSGRSEIGGNDFMITLGPGTRELAKVATFMHEYGHTLNLFHGGGQSVSVTNPANGQPQE